MFKTLRLMSWAGLPVVALFLVPAAARAQDRALWKTDFDNYIVHPDSIYTYADADPVPSLEEPAFETVAQAEQWLNDREPIAVVSINGETKAYPIQIMMQHDVANDAPPPSPVSAPISRHPAPIEFDTRLQRRRRSCSGVSLILNGRNRDPRDEYGLPILQMRFRSTPRAFLVSLTTVR